MGIFFGIIGGVLAFAFAVDVLNRKRQSPDQQSTHPRTKPGEASNYQMGDTNHSTGPY
ncbi:hypothetical protein ACFO0S_06940 [Chryseomicrobium palamuruense]|uniref:Uncharacterized protein n=1 Tax=Chryseomicrobium palamuruense TaxID=682973 RepID=A0ABV8UUE2_9BACL